MTPLLVPKAIYIATKAEVKKRIIFFIKGRFFKFFFIKLNSKPKKKSYMIKKSIYSLNIHSGGSVVFIPCDHPVTDPCLYRNRPFERRYPCVPRCPISYGVLLIL